MLIFSPDSIGNDNIGSQGETDEKIQDHADHRAVGTYRSNGNSTVCAGKISYDRNIRCVKQLFQNSGCCYRESVQRNLIPDRTVLDVQLCGLFF